MRVFDSATEALSFLGTLSGEDSARYVFRGEPKQYPLRLPAAARRSPDYYEEQASYVHFLARHLYDDHLQKKFGHCLDGPILDGNVLEFPDLLERASSYGYAQLIWQLSAFLQHYGHPTNWLDLTFDPRVALFFASWLESEHRHAEDGIGYIYYTQLYMIPDGSWPLIDLHPFSELLSRLLGLTAERSRAQSACALRFSPRMAEANDAANHFECIAFRRDSTVKLMSPKVFFPDETVSTWLDSFVESKQDWWNQVRSKVYEDK